MVLYEGFQPVEAGAGATVRALSSRVAWGTAAANQPPPPTATAATAAAPPPAAVAPGGAFTARWGEALTLRGVRLTSSTLLVFQLLMSKPGVAGLPTREALVAWGFAPVLTRGRLAAGSRSVPLFRLPLLLVAKRKFTYEGALLDFKVARYSGAPGDLDLFPLSAPAAPDNGGGGDGAAVTNGAEEDLPGVPAAAWVRVQRGTPPADPYTPGDGFAVIVDGARFLPTSATITRVQAAVWSSGGRQLSGGRAGGIDLSYVNQRGRHPTRSTTDQVQVAYPVLNPNPRQLSSRGSPSPKAPPPWPPPLPPRPWWDKAQSDWTTPPPLSCCSCRRWSVSQGRAPSWVLRCCRAFWILGRAGSQSAGAYGTTF